MATVIPSGKRSRYLPTPRWQSPDFEEDCGQSAAEIGQTQPSIYSQTLGTAKEYVYGPPGMKSHITKAGGFLAALDQSGGSTPGALRLYGIPESAYSGEAEMFACMHEMRVRVMTAPAFTGDKVIGAILFERTMDGEVQGKPVPSYLWEDRACVPFLKVDKGLEAEADGVSLMRPIPGLDALLDRAVRLGVFGTKMRATINLPSESGIAAIAEQQFEIGAQIARHGLVPILEPEVLIKSPDKAERRSSPPGCAGPASGCAAVGPAGDAEADDPGRSRPLQGPDRP